ncbi:hypothetical protein DFH08DRAFT_1043701 [Mycena albidolilacea]|uniref:Uncharacterized protein n=1 Tax=Mycena albidolilacea TaxID=1033008 RepID=A0AAD7AH80_9AGAR|nr:hypothetical protein DFH08DRAFT_1043701 [Mycena albidolilacea]
MHGTGPYNSLWREIDTVWRSNPHLRELNRLKMQERSQKTPMGHAPPSKNTTGIICFCGIPHLQGPGSDFSYHYRNFRGITETDIAHSDFARQDSGGPLTTQSSEHNIAADSVDDVDHSPDERIAVEALALMAEGGHTARSQGSQQGSTATMPRGQQATASEVVVRVLTSVVQLNEGSFTPTTPLEEHSWVRRDFWFQGDYVEYKAFTYIKCWSWGVYTSTAGTTMNQFEVHESTKPMSSKKRIAGNVIPGAELAAISKMFSVWRVWRQTSQRRHHARM